MGTFLYVIFFIFTIINIALGKAIEILLPSNILWWVIFVVIGIIAYVANYNKFVALKKKVEQARGTIDVYLKQRFDLIPNVVEVVKASKEHEEKVLTKLVEIRNSYMKNKDNLEENAKLYNEAATMFAIVENYPELKSSEAFLNLQKLLSKIESQLQAARRIYNSEVTEYNTAIHKLPQNIVANLSGFKDEELFNIVESQRENVNVKDSF